MPLPRRLAIAALAAGSVVALPRIRARMLGWGATAAERAAAYSDAQLIPDGRRASVMATTIAAPPAAVWPWLVQMGCDRAGFYSWDRLDNGGRPSAQRIHPEWQQLAVGDRIACVPDGSVWFDVTRLEPQRELVLRSSLELPRGRWFDPTGRPPRAFSDSTWSFYLAPADGDRTRLVVTGVGRGAPRWVVGSINRLFWEPAHWIMQTRQFAQLRRRAETVSPPA